MSILMCLVPFHTVVQLLAFVKFHEWREPRPGYVNCAECHAEFQGAPIASRHHRPHCRIGSLIKELQAIVNEAKAEEGSITMPFPKTREALKENGYVFSHTKMCEACNVTIEMWITPRENVMPLDFRIDNETQTEICEPHFATCKKPELYSRKLREKKAKEQQQAAGGAGDVGPILP